MNFSVLIPTYNVASIVERAIRSAVTQTLPPGEILVIDDCSSDGTPEVVEALGREFPTIKLIRLTKNSGPSVARNVGVKAATGEWLALLDGDDAWLPDRLEKMSRAAEEWKADFVADNLVMWDPVKMAPVQTGDGSSRRGFPDHRARLFQ